MASHYPCTDDSTSRAKLSPVFVIVSLIHSLTHSHPLSFNHSLTHTYTHLHSVYPTVPPMCNHRTPCNIPTLYLTHYIFDPCSMIWLRNKSQQSARFLMSVFLINYSAFEMFRKSKCSSSGKIVRAVSWSFMHPYKQSGRWKDSSTVVPSNFAMHEIRPKLLTDMGQGEFVSRQRCENVTPTIRRNCCRLLDSRIHDSCN